MICIQLQLKSFIAETAAEVGEATVLTVRGALVVGEKLVSEEYYLPVG